MNGANEPPQPPRCECSRLGLCKRTYANGTEHVVEQCLDCGRQLRSLGKDERIKRGIFVSKLPSWDEGIVDRWRALQNRFWERHRRSFEETREERDREWRARYEAHIASPEWQALRRKVLLRCQGICEGCGERQAAHVHHLTYERLGAEMLFDLAGVCIPCHEKIHGRPIGEGVSAHSHP